MRSASQHRRRCPGESGAGGDSADRTGDRAPVQDAAQIRDALASPGARVSRQEVRRVHAGRAAARRRDGLQAVRAVARHDGSAALSPRAAHRTDRGVLRSGHQDAVRGGGRAGRRRGRHRDARADPRAAGPVRESRLHPEGDGQQRPAGGSAGGARGAGDLRADGDHGRRRQPRPRACPAGGIAFATTSARRSPPCRSSPPLRWPFRSRCCSRT